MKRIHIVGCGPRTGTTLLAEMMIAGFEIDLSTKHEDSIYTCPPYLPNVYLTKMPGDILVVEPVLRIMPNLYVIYMVRDPRDMAVSKHARDPDRYWAGLRYWKTYTPYAHKLESHPRFITVRYEDLVAFPDRIQNHLMERMPFLKKRTPFSRFHESAQPSEDSVTALGGLRPASLSRVGNWRNHLPRVAGQLYLHGSISDDLIAYGYEQTNAWEKELEGVAPDISESHWPEYFSAAELKLRMHHKYLRAVSVVLAHCRLTRPVRKGLVVIYKKLDSWLKKFFLKNEGAA